MAIFEDNVLPVSKNKKLRCKCGSCRYDVEVCKNDDYDTWILISCKKCGKTLYYNGG